MQNAFHEDLKHQIVQPESPVRQMVLSKARRFQRHARLRHFDRSDIEQTIWKVLLKALAKYSPERGELLGYCHKVVDSAIANFLRHHAVDLRRCDEQVSLEELTPEILELTLGAEMEGADLCVDLAEALASLPPDQRTICLRLMTETKSEAARQLGIPRTTLQGRIEKLRHQLAAAGLKDHHTTGRLTPSKNFR
ncbi:sigma-70 family RNA polymerase sigma factor [Rubinisphaera margarita]|uniref:sigma-70 family RNA polymerase sigma factor n=1 Tax=Rubinisphaera margarita TaxID=2909586 RepID=UPI001EE84AC8|nr:sigma-70 family RNA polymerase sigma factor [Rubinisphaera margarita]MCG6158330.1 sigma-70 family RNA polymerase sigma factor [Rubinisphaera margarita]